MIRTACRLGVAFALIVGCVVWSASGLGILPDIGQERARTRVRTCESLALTATWLAQNGYPLHRFDDLVDQYAARNPSIVSVTVKRGAKIIAQAGNLAVASQPTKGSTTDNMSLAIYVNGQPWGAVNVRYQPLAPQIFMRDLMLIGFLGASCGLIGWFMLARSFRYLNPGTVVPTRVRNALDAMAEGLAVVDTSNVIVLTNRAFGSVARTDVVSLVGRSPSTMDWRDADGETKLAQLPWETAIATHHTQRGVTLSLVHRDGEVEKYLVNATPILDDKQKCRGALISFDDITEIEQKREELGKTIDALESSRNEIQEQNSRLQFLASRDPMTGCFNRRAFLESAEKAWRDSGESSMTIMMLDIDKFKSINDNFGHATGDEVIRRVAGLVHRVVGESGLVCRYGGEEFCVLLPGLGYEAAIALAEEARTAIASEPVEEVDVTISVGVSCRSFKAMDLQHFIEQADTSLYAAKRNGRNRVVGWDHPVRQEMGEIQAEAASKTELLREHHESQATVAALYTSLYFRDRRTALHSARVASIASELALRTLSPEIAQTVRTAAVLHDIGKIGIPDTILHRPDKLTADELELVRRKDSIAMHISQSALISQDVGVLLSRYSEPYANGSGWGDLRDASPELFVACHILHLADAFDSMINESEYRSALTIENAIEQIKEHAPRQFVPELIPILEECLSMNPGCLAPLQVPGAILHDEMPTETEQWITEGTANFAGPLKRLMRKLKKESLSGSAEIQDTVEELERNLERNDQELQDLFRSTKEVLELCRSTTTTPETDDVLSWLNSR